MDKTQIFKASINNVDIAVEALKAGEIIVYPTDTLYGFGVDASNDHAIKKLNKLKNRSLPLSIMISKIDDITKYGYLSDIANNQISKILPGPYTILLKSRNNIKISNLVQAGSELIGMRFVNIDFCNQLINKLESPIITTSINKHGMESMSNIDDIISAFPSIKTFYDKKNLISKGSTIIDFSIMPEKVIRVGEGEYL